MSLRLDCDKIVYSYIAADKCINLAIEIDKAAVQEDDKRILSKYLQLLDASKELKVYLASQTQKTPNLSEIQRYGRFSFLNIA